MDVTIICSFPYFPFLSLILLLLLKVKFLALKAISYRIKYSIWLITSRFRYEQWIAYQALAVFLLKIFLHDNLFDRVQHLEVSVELAKAVAIFREFLILVKGFLLFGEE